MIFPWLPDIDSTVSVEPSVKVTKFGDGYESRTPVGINTTGRKWPVKFTRPRAEAFQILDFLEARNATEKFTWTDPFGRTGTWVCRKWSAQSSQGYVVVSGDFEQVFEP